MLLEDLIDTKIKNKKVDDWYDPDSSEDDGDELGRGTAAHVLKNPDDPHTVKRNSHSAQRATTNRKGEFEHRRFDGFNVWAKFIIDNKLAEKNPYFPRIYEVERISDKGDNQFYKYETEKLYPMSSLSREEMIAISEKLTGREQIYYPEQIEWFLQKVILENKDTPDDALVECRKYMKQFVDETNMKIDDLGGDNILVRRTSLGVQLVINDPIYGYD